MKLIKYTTTLCTLLLFASCLNDDDFSSGENTTETQNTNVLADNFGDPILRDFIGKISDINGQPLNNVTITIGTESANTDANGVFLFRDAQVFKRFGYIKAEKAGFIDASRSIVPVEGTNRIAITMLPKSTTATTQSGTVETISLSNGAAVALQGEYIKENGEAYNGTVKVTMHHLDAAAEETQTQMPGMLYAQNSQGEEQMLITMGMLAIELTGSNGEDLNLATGSTAEITVPVSQSLLSSAPQTIPLWYFNEDFGYWVEEGEATLQGDKYVGTVSHFSFWNCDISSNAVVLTINYHRTNGQPVPNIKVNLTAIQFGDTRYGITNENGQVSGLVPSNTSLLLTMQIIGCNDEVFYSENIQPLSTDTTIDIVNDITITDTMVINESVTGVLLNCAGDMVETGYINLNYQQTYVALVENGNFQIDIPRCLNSSDIFSYSGGDYITGQTSENLSGTFTTPLTNVGSFEVCESSLNEYYYVRQGTNLSMYFNSDLNYFTLPSDIFGLYTKEFNNWKRNIYIKLPSKEEATYNLNDEGVYLNFMFDTFNHFDSTSNEHDITITVLGFGDVDQFIQIEFVGTYVDNNNETQDVSGFFRKIRPY